MSGIKAKICVIGAGPAGLAAAYELVQHGTTDVIVIDRHEMVGGLARTVSSPGDGARFDIGPHRYFTKNAEVKALWFRLLGDDFITVSRTTRIFYRGKLFNYPIKAGDVLIKLGIWSSFLSFLSYIRERIIPRRNIRTFEDWVTAKFGGRLYRTFFKYYTEKVWGIPCSEIEARWAAQRIKGLNFTEVVKKVFGGTAKAKSLVESFYYPRKGAGQMYEAMADVITKAGGRVMLATEVMSYQLESDRLVSLEVKDAAGNLSTITADHFFNSAPITAFFERLSVPPPPAVAEACKQLYYRAHITVNMLVEGTDLFPDQWIYIHDPSFQMARLANYNNFASDMVEKSGFTAVSAEYFTFEHETLWKMDDEALMQLAVEEVRRLGLVGTSKVKGVSVIRERESYPTYFMGYEQPFNVLKDHLDRIRNVSPVGRGGLYKYNNQDHSIYSGLVAVRNYLFPDHHMSVWQINIDAEYQEEEYE